MHPHTMRVIFGGQTIKAFVSAPANMRVLGIVRMDQEFGLLAMNGEGKYVRVNGSQVMPLDEVEVRRAINKARATCRTDPFQDATEFHPGAIAALIPKVTVRKRRHIEVSRSDSFERNALAA